MRFDHLTRARGAIVVAPLLATTALAGCGTSLTNISGSQTKTKSPNACDVLTLQTAKSVIGSTAKLTRKKQPNPKETQCGYTSKSGAADVEVGDWDTIKGFGFEADTDKKVAGIGDQAWTTGTDFVAQKGKYGVDITLILKAGDFSGSAATSEENRTNKAAERLAPKLLAKLP